MRLIWAHTGIGGTPPRRVDALFGALPGSDGRAVLPPGFTCGAALCPDWRALLLKYPDRFLIGSDTWVNQRWLQYDGLMNGYRVWLGDLPPRWRAALRGPTARDCLRCQWTPCETARDFIGQCPARICRNHFATPMTKPSTPATAPTWLVQCIDALDTGVLVFDAKFRWWRRTAAWSNCLALLRP